MGSRKASKARKSTGATERTSRRKPAPVTRKRSAPRRPPPPRLTAETVEKIRLELLGVRDLLSVLAHRAITSELETVLLRYALPPIRRAMALLGEEQQS